MPPSPPSDTHPSDGASLPAVPTGFAAGRVVLPVNPPTEALTATLTGRPVEVASDGGYEASEVARMVPPPALARAPLPVMSPAMVPLAAPPSLGRAPSPVRLPVSRAQAPERPTALAGAPPPVLSPAMVAPAVPPPLGRAPPPVRPPLTPPVTSPDLAALATPLVLVRAVKPPLLSPSVAALATPPVLVRGVGPPPQQHPAAKARRLPLPAAVRGAGRVGPAVPAAGGAPQPLLPPPPPGVRPLP